jgi:hypothetical protein
MPDCISCEDPFGPHKCAECGVVIDRCHECHIEVVHGRLGEAAGAGWGTAGDSDGSGGVSGGAMHESAGDEGGADPVEPAAE